MRSKEKNMKSCCIIGHRKISEKINLNNLLTYLIENKKVSIFNFGFYGEFNDLCYKTILGLKFRYPHIKLIFYSLNNEVAFTFEEAGQYIEKYEKKNKEFPYKCFDEIVYLNEIDETKFKYAYVLRNKKLIDESDYCLFYYRENYVLPNKGNSGTKIAYDYARDNKKNIILI